MNGGIWIIALLLLLGLIPFFILFEVSLSDLRKTRRQKKKNEEDIRQMIDRMERRGECETIYRDYQGDYDNCRVVIVPELKES